MKVKATLILVVMVLGMALVGCGNKVPDTAEGVVKAAMDAAKNNELGKIYVMLPESYQKDVQGLVKMVADKVDKETYDNMMKAVDKLIAGLSKHKDKLFEQAKGMKPDMKKEDADKLVAQIEIIWKAVKDAGLNTHDGLAKLDVAKFLDNQGKTIIVAGRTIAEIMGQGAQVKMMDETLAKIKVEVKEATETKTTLTMTMGEDKQEVVFVKVEDRWVPEMMSAMWKAGIKNANDELAKGLKEYEGKKDELKKMSATVLEAATKFEESGDFTGLMGMASAF